MLSDSHPLHRLVLEPTYACNLRCRHCYVYRSAGAVKRMGQIRHSRPLSFWQKVVQNAPDGITVHLTGGELFAYAEIFALLEAVHDQFAFTCSTNGTYLDPNTCRRLADLSPHHITLSLLGPETIHDAITGVRGSFRKAVKAIETLNQYLPEGKLSLNCVLLPENANALDEVIRLAERLGVARLVIQLFDPALNRCGIVAGIEQVPPPRYLDWSGTDLNSLHALLERIHHREDSTLHVEMASSMTPQEIINYVNGEFQLEQWACAEVFDTMRCSPAGIVYTCTGLEIGSLETHPISDLWQSQQFTAFRQAHSHTTLESGCKGCCKVRRAG